jgi:uncharacterized repeat protein (TIGR03803 family)
VRTCIDASRFCESSYDSSNVKSVLFLFAGLAYASDGNFYGTSVNGNGSNVLFRLTPDGVITTVHTLDFRAEGNPGFLLPGPSGQLYRLLYGALQATRSSASRWTAW